MEEWLKATAEPEKAASEAVPIHETPPAKESRPKTTPIKSPTMDHSDKYKHIKPNKYKPSENALLYEKKLSTMKLVGAPEGLTFIPEFITDAEEQSLIQLSRNWKWDQEVSTRETVQFGHHYIYSTKGIKEGRPWPKELDWLRQRLVDKGIFPELPNQSIVNRIKPPHGHGAHIDSTKHFKEPIGILGTESAVNIVFWNEDGTEYHVVRSQRRSLIVLTGAARYEYYHSIPEGIDDLWKHHTTARGIRTSYTLRLMSE